MKYKPCLKKRSWPEHANKLITTCLLAMLMLSSCLRGGEPVLVYLPTATLTPTVTTTPTITPTPEATSTRRPTQTPTVTPYPWLEIELSIVDAQSGAPVLGEVVVGLRVDENQLGFPIEQNVSTLVFTMPRGVTRAEVVYINVMAPGYTNRLMILPDEAKTERRLSFEVQMRKRN